MSVQIQLRRIILARTINRIAQHPAHVRGVRALLPNMLTVAIEAHTRAVGQQSTIEHLNVLGRLFCKQ